MNLDLDESQISENKSVTELIADYDDDTINSNSSPTKSQVNGVTYFSSPQSMLS